MSTETNEQVVETAGRDWVLCFVEWKGTGRFHVRRAVSPDDPRSREALCGLIFAPRDLVGDRIKFEDELDDSHMCKTCRKRGIKIGEKEDS